MIGSNFNDFEVNPNYSRDILKDHKNNYSSNMQDFAESINSFLAGNYNKISHEEGEEHEEEEQQSSNSGVLSFG